MGKPPAATFVDPLPLGGVLWYSSVSVWEVRNCFPHFFFEICSVAGWFVGSVFLLGFMYGVGARGIRLLTKQGWYYKDTCCTVLEDEWQCGTVPVSAWVFERNLGVFP